MEQDIDVPAADPEGTGHVVPWLLIEQAEKDDGLLRLAEPVHAGPEPDVLLSSHHEILRGVEDRRSGLQRVVRARHVVAPAPVARGVAHDAGEERREARRGGRQLAPLAEPEEGAERVLHAVDRVLGRGAFTARDTDELTPFGAGDAAEGLEDVERGRGSGHDVVHRGQGAEPAGSYAERSAVRTLLLGTWTKRERQGDNPMASSKNVFEVNDGNFEAEVLKADRPVLVDFGATWCGPCKALAPIVDKIADESVGKLKVAKIDIDESPGVAKRYGVRSAPTVLLFRGGEKTAQHVGLTNKETLLRLLEI